MRVVAALGGNALLRRGEPLDLATQRANARVAARALAELARDHDLVVTHGNGPQVGLLALQAAAGRNGTPLDVLGAESDGMIGYVLAQELGNAMAGGEVVTLLTQVVVEASDPAFDHPTKPIGPTYADRGAAGAAQSGSRWAIARDGGAWRRVVASPEPRAIVELEPIRCLLAAGVVVICAGGGGVPVVSAPDGSLTGIEAVVDKDLTAALLATQLRADALLLLTDVDAVHLDHGMATERAVAQATPDELRALGLPAGSMGPKAEAAARFVAATGAQAAIGRLEDASALLAGRAGTVIRCASHP
ncbi:MAG: carbamate kinase [Solirubrobacteraceae bacterium]